MYVCMSYDVGHINVFSGLVYYEASCTAYGECCVWDKSACYYNAEDDDWLTGSKLHKDCPRN
jgi:hypothetical protein